MVENHEPLTRQNICKILEQMDKSFYKINEENGQFYFGCFFHIKTGEKIIPVLLINKYLKFEEYKSQIDISINNQVKTIELGDTIYKNKNINISMIEIKDNKNYNINYLELDDTLKQKELENIYNNESIYIMQLNNKTKDILVSYSVMNNIFNSKFFFKGKINEDFSIIFNLSNNKLVGLFTKKSKLYNQGILFNFLVDKFIDKYNIKINIKEKNKYKYHQTLTNEILLKIIAFDSNVKEKVYFLDNYAYIDNKGMNHFHDNLKELNELNTELIINNKKEKYKKYFIPEKEGEYDITLKFNVNLTDCSYMFAGCKNILNINFISFNTKYVKSAKYMFHRCIYLSKLNLSIFNTKNINDMSDMFSLCYFLENIDISSFDTKNLKDMSYMFYNCYNLKYINLSFFEFRNNVNINYFFNVNGPKIINSNMKNYQMEKINNKYENEIDILVKVDKNEVNQKIYFLDNFLNLNMFKMNNDLRLFNPKIFINEKKYEKYQNYFIPEKEGEYNIKVKFDINLINCEYMFYGCKNIIKINFKRFNTNSVTNMSSMFSDCENIKILNLSHFETKNVTNMSYMFSACSNLENIDLSSFNTNEVIDMTAMFSFCNNLISLDLSNFNTNNVKTINSMFQYCEKLVNLNLSSFDTQNITDMSNTFSDCINLKSLNLSSFNTKKVTNMLNMFSNCKSINYLDLSSFNTENVQDMSHMFSSCESLENLNLSSFNTKNVKKMSYMFYSCNSLENLDLSSFDTKNVIDMDSMFSNCVNLINLNISTFNTINVINMNSMFSQCENLCNLDLSNFNVNNVLKIKSIFFHSEKILDSNCSIFKKFKREEMVDFYL